MQTDWGKPGNKTQSTPELYYLYILAFAVSDTKKTQFQESDNGTKSIFYFRAPFDWMGGAMLLWVFLGMWFLVTVSWHTSCVWSWQCPLKCCHDVMNPQQMNPHAVLKMKWRPWTHRFFCVHMNTKNLFLLFYFVNRNLCIPIAALWMSFCICYNCVNHVISYLSCICTLALFYFIITSACCKPREAPE